MTQGPLVNSKQGVTRSISRIAVALVAALAGCLMVAAADGRAAYVNGKIAFIHSDEDVNGDVFSINPDGTEARNLTNHPATDSVALWAFGGAKIAFASAREGEDPSFGNQDIFIMNADGGGLVNLTRRPDADDGTPAWSPDNSQIAFESDRGGDYDVYVANADGSGIPRNLTRNPGDHDAYPYFSPDGLRLTFTRFRDEDPDHEIYDLDLNGGAPARNLTNDPALDTGANYSPDGTKIAFMSDRDDPNWSECHPLGLCAYDIFVMDADGSNPSNITAGSLADDGNPNWSPDGRLIAFHSNRDQDGDGAEDDYEIFVMSTDGTAPRQVTDNEGDDQLPDWARIEPGSPGTPPASGGTQGSTAVHQPAGAADHCASLLQRPRVSVTHWQRLAGRRFGRLKVAAGGYVVRPDRTTPVTFQTQRRRGGPAGRVRQVAFSLDGRPVAVDRRAPYRMTLRPGTLKTGQHELVAVAKPGRGKQIRVRLGFVAANCESAAFSASMINKQPRKASDLELRVQTGGPVLKGARIGLSPDLRVSLRGLAGKRIGTVELASPAGRKVKRALVLPRGRRGRADLVAGGNPQVTLNLRGRRASLELSDAESYAATSVRIALSGRRTGLLRNPRRCLRHRYEAKVQTTAGNLALKRTLQMCKGRSRR